MNEHRGGMARAVARLVLVSFLLASVTAPAVQAGMVGTGDWITEVETLDVRGTLQMALQRPELRQQLVDLGVDPAVAELRVATLTDAEVAALSGQLDELPAGGNGIVGALLIVFLVLLATDIMGLTDVFPFVRK